MYPLGYRLILLHSMGDLLGFNGFLNGTTPFSPKEHKVLYKTEREYLDFAIGNTYKDTCEYPRFWNESGQRVLKESNVNFSQLVGCFDSEFDQVCVSSSPMVISSNSDARTVWRYGSLRCFP